MPTVQFQLRNGTRDEWEAANSVLGKGEPGCESDTGQMKIGDGIRSWNLLSYVAAGEAGGVVPRNSLITGTKWLVGGSNAGDGAIFTSGNGSIWYLPITPPVITGAYVYSIIYDGLRWILGADGGGTNAIFESLDGETWVAVQNDPFNGGICYAIAFNGSQYVAVGTSVIGQGTNTNTVYSSRDRITWNPAVLDPFAGADSGAGYAVCWTGRNWIIGGSDVSAMKTPQSSTSNIFTSPDGLTWTKFETTFFNNGTVYGIAYNGGRYVFAGTNGGSLFTSNDPGTATLATCTDAEFEADTLNGITNDPFGSGNANGIAWNGEYWMAVGTNIPPVGELPLNIVTCAISADGLVWSPTQPFGNGIGYGVAWSGNDWVLSGTNVAPNVAAAPSITSVYGRDGLNWIVGTNAVNTTADSVQYTVAVKNILAGAPVPTIFASGMVGELQVSDGNGNFVSNANVYLDTDYQLHVPVLNAGGIVDSIGSTGLANQLLSSDGTNVIWVSPPVMPSGITPKITGTTLGINIPGMKYGGVVVASIVGVVSGLSCYITDLITYTDGCGITLSEHANPHVVVHWMAPSLGFPIAGSIAMSVSNVTDTSIGLTFTHDLSHDDVAAVVYEITITGIGGIVIGEEQFNSGVFFISTNGIGLTPSTAYDCYITASLEGTSISSNVVAFNSYGPETLMSGTLAIIVTIPTNGEISITPDTSAVTDLPTGGKLYDLFYIIGDLEVSADQSTFNYVESFFTFVPSAYNIPLDTLVSFRVKLIDPAFPTLNTIYSAESAGFIVIPYDTPAP